MTFRRLRTSSRLQRSLAGRDEARYSGPYKIGVQGEGPGVLIRNDNYYGTAANIDKITMKYIDKLDVAENAYRADSCR